MEVASSQRKTQNLLPTTARYLVFHYSAIGVEAKMWSKDELCRIYRRANANFTINKGPEEKDFHTRMDPLVNDKTISGECWTVNFVGCGTE